MPSQVSYKQRVVCIAAILSIERSAVAFVTDLDNLSTVVINNFSTVVPYAIFALDFIYLNIFRTMTITHIWTCWKLW